MQSASYITLSDLELSDLFDAFGPFRIGKFSLENSVK